MIHNLFVGFLGIGGYLLPICSAIIGGFYIHGNRSKTQHTAGLLISLSFILMSFFHVLCYQDQSTYSLMSKTYIQNGAWNNGGWFGAFISYILLKLIGLYGTYVFLLLAFGIWLLVATQFPIFSWFYEKIIEGSTLLRASIKQSVTNRKKAKKGKASQSILKSKEEVTPAPSLMMPLDLVEAAPANSLEPIPIYDSTSYVESLEISDLSEEVGNKPTLVKQQTSKKATKEALLSNEPLDIPEREVVPTREYIFPSVELLNKGQVAVNKDASRKSLSTAKKLELTLESFGVEAKVLQIHKGPTVTRYELQPKQGVKVSKIVNLADDIALNLAASNIRIEAPIPGKAAVGIEVANETSEMVYLRDVIDSDRFLAFPSKLAFALGKDIAGKPIIADIGKMPHILIAGATGSGKSVCINTLVTSILYKARPEEVKLIMIDPKVVELSVYNGIPHLLIPVVTDPKKAAGALWWAVNEMTRRYNLFAENNVRDMKGYNEKCTEELLKLPQIVIIIDELADLMMTAAKEVEDAICRLAQMARAAGIHLVIATQRPSVDVITGVIKANIPSRLAFAVSSGIDSRTIIDMNGAEKLLGKGDMLFNPVGEAKPIRIQGAFISDQEVENIVNAVRVEEHQYEENVIESIEKVNQVENSEDEQDELLEKAIAFSVDKEKLSISMLQRYFRIGFNRAARLMDALETRGIVGPDEGSKPRKVL
ncbi:cell division protein FtsK [Sporanaerobium hydrogeniformans]|uniref:Cell division protein FtsK n=2 Tax=Sporanaerobium hydrogeniformans TaxID=3072179 RepID=A0AC61DCV4_9FIRM|nr:cell division protein FtsK [Sporanaerobium hydrogeniformans]